VVNQPSEYSKEQLMELGVPGELAEKIADGTIPAFHSLAQGGKGGHSISLTYIDNYSTLLLVYTFLLNLLDDDAKKWRKNNQVNQSLLTTLQQAMKEQQEYKKAFLDAVKSLNQS